MVDGILERMPPALGTDASVVATPAPGSDDRGHRQRCRHTPAHGPQPTVTPHHTAPARAASQLLSVSRPYAADPPTYSLGLLRLDGLEWLTLHDLL